MIKICMVAYTHYQWDPRVRREAEALAARGDTVHVVSLRERGEAAESVIDGVHLFGLRMPRYRGGSAARYVLRYLRFFLAASWKLARLHARHRYDLVQAHTMPDFIVFAGLIPRIFGSRILLDVHDLSPELYMSKFDLEASHWLIRLLKWVERRSIGFADRAIAVHEPHLDVLVEHGNPRDKFITLVNLPDERWFHRAPDAGTTPREGFCLMYHGTVARRHGLETAIRAVGAVAEQCPGLRLVIVGDGDDVARLRTVAQELELADRVEFRQGFVPIEELVPILHEADTGIVPLHDEPFSRLMLPTKLLEYVKLGVPVISSRTPTIEHYFDDSMVRYVTPEDVDELAAAILELYRDPEARSRLAANAEAFNRTHDWNRQRQRYFDLIDQLAGSKGQGND